MRSASANRARGSGWAWPRRRRSSRAPFGDRGDRDPHAAGQVLADGLGGLGAGLLQRVPQGVAGRSGGECLRAQQRPQHAPFVGVAEVSEAGQVDGQVAGLAAEAGVAADDPQLGPVGEQDGGQGAVPGADLGLPLRAEFPGPAAGGRGVQVLAGRGDQDPGPGRFCPRRSRLPAPQGWRGGRGTASRSSPASSAPGCGPGRGCWSRRCRRSGGAAPGGRAGCRPGRQRPRCGRAARAGTGPGRRGNRSTGRCRRRRCSACSPRRETNPGCSLRRH